MDEMEQLRLEESRRHRLAAESRRRAKRRRRLLRGLKQVLLISGCALGGIALILAAAFVLHGRFGKKDSGSKPPAVATADTEAVGQGAEAAAETGGAAVQEDAPAAAKAGQLLDIGGVQFLSGFTAAETDDTRTIPEAKEDIVSEYVVLIDESTNRIVAEKQADEVISPASMTKILTVLVAAEQLAAENRMDGYVEITIEMTDYVYQNDCSAVGFSVGEVVPVQDLFYGTILPSGADAAIALASYTAGSHEAFVKQMNAKLEQLGLSDTAHFTNCVGLYDPEHHCTVKDMAMILKAALENDFCREVLSAHRYTTTATKEHPDGINLSNLFLRRIEDHESGGVTQSAKTGYVNQSGSCAASYFLSDSSTPYICVTAKSTSSWRCIFDHVEIYKTYTE